ncbi:pectate lyase a [Powellomyces hirtus]|nr:pectate lyase a [Powellomyces hirtus]
MKLLPLIYGALLAFGAGVDAQRRLVGRIRGFGSRVTGGGEVRPVYPKDNAELIKYLEDSRPRVIYLNRMYNFVGSEGRKTEVGCRPASNTCPARGQDAINAASNWCGDAPKVNVDYDVAGTKAINVQGHKTLRGIGRNSGLQGKGLRIMGPNVIVQNIHIMDLNPQYIWGGDAIYIQATNGDFLIDHNRFSLIGRQMIGTATAGGSRRITISNNHFSGASPWSASCDGKHYWTMLFLGTDDKISFHGNLIENTSGRGPKVGGPESSKGNPSVRIHAVNNYWRDVSGHAFDVYKGSVALIEGNTFQNVKTSVMLDGGSVFMPATNKACSLNRLCVANTGATTADPSKVSVSTVGRQFTTEGYGSVTSAARAKTWINRNAGPGHI